MDGFTGFETATTEELPDAVAAMDPFHVVRLAGDALGPMPTPDPTDGARTPGPQGRPAVPAQPTGLGENGDRVPQDAVVRTCRCRRGTTVVIGPQVMGLREVLGSGSGRPSSGVDHQAALDRHSALVRSRLTCRNTLRVGSRRGPSLARIEDLDGVPPRG